MFRRKAIITGSESCEVRSAPQIVPLDSVECAEDILEIRYRGAKLQLPGNVDVDAVAAILRSIQSQ